MSEAPFLKSYVQYTDPFQPVNHDQSFRAMRWVAATRNAFRPTPCISAPIRIIARVAASSLALKEGAGAHDSNALVHDPLAHTEVFANPLLDLGGVADALRAQTGPAR